MESKTWNSWIVLVFGIGALHAQADNVTNELIQRLLWDSPEQHIAAFMANNKLSAGSVAESLKAIVRAGDVKIADDEVLSRDRELGCKAAEMKIAGQRALSVMGDLRLPNCQDFLIEVYNRPDGVGRHSAGKAIIHIGGTNALAFADTVLATNKLQEHATVGLCEHIWQRAAGYYRGVMVTNEDMALFREYLVKEPFLEMKLHGAKILGDGVRAHSEPYRLSIGREECLRLVIEKGLDNDGYFANQLAGLLAERHVKESGGLSITNEGGYVTNVPRPSTVSASLDTGAIAVVSRSVVEPVTNGGVTTPGATVETASPPRASFRVWIVFGCAAAILALLAALAVRRRSQRC